MQTQAVKGRALQNSGSRQYSDNSQQLHKRIRQGALYLTCLPWPRDVIEIHLIATTGGDLFPTS